MSEASIICPKYLYKFVRDDKFTIENLTNRQIYLNTPDKFNDPFDTIDVFFGKVSDTNAQNAFIEKVKQKYHSEWLESEEAVKRYWPDPTNEEFRSVEILRHFINKRARAKFGVASMANLEQCGKFTMPGNHCSMVMFSHYGGFHRGLCLEYEMKGIKRLVEEKELDLLAVEPNLVKFPIDIGFAEDLCWSLIEGEYTESVKDTGYLSKKFPSWQYENEYRIVGKPGIQLHDERMLRRVFFGMRMEETRRDFYYKLIKSVYPEVECYRCVDTYHDGHKGEYQELQGISVVRQYANNKLSEILMSYQNTA